MSIGLNGDCASMSCMARVTWLVASVQISISCWRRSSSVMMPRSYWLSTLAASPSNFSSSPAFCGGVVTSAMEIVRPARVDHSNPRAFSLSRLSATTALS